MVMKNDRRAEALGNLRVLPDEVVCEIISFLSLQDVARLSCVSSVMYIFCNEEPLWMSLCLKTASGLLEYKGSWKNTTLQLNTAHGNEAPLRKLLHFEGFYSLFLYKRWYRCYTSLGGFSVDNGNVERKINLSMEDFQNKYDGKKPVLIAGLADSWPAREKWTLDQLLLNYGDTTFKISQRSPRKIKMKFKDYVSYMKLQHDEDPLYIFDEKFGEVAPGLLKEYAVPHLFQEDLFNVLNPDQRPPYRWFIIGPERSGASWHVDPALTSAWNTLLCGRKRWALYPPGKVPLGVTVHVNEEDGDVNIETPSSLQWWLEFYPLLPDEDKPLECTQLPGETIFVPSGWWHCVLNLEPTVAVTQNFVNSTNFEYVCLDLAPGFRHKGVCRAGFLALDDGNIEDVDEVTSCARNCSKPRDVLRKEKRIRSDHVCHDSASNAAAANCCNVWNNDLPYNINFLSKFLDEHRDHYNSMWSSSNCIGQREMREWLWRLWIGKPEMRDLIWKGACLAINAGEWLECIEQVYLIAENVIKIYVEGGLESSVYSLGTELEFYNLLLQEKSPLKEHVPDVLASGFISLANGYYTIVPWDGKGMPHVIADNISTIEGCKGYGNSFGLWSKKLFDYKNAGLNASEISNLPGNTKIWPYIVTKRCKGKIFAELQDSLSWENALDLASFLGEQLHNLHILPLPQHDNLNLANIRRELGLAPSITSMKIDSLDSNDAAVWEIFLHSLIKKDVVSHLKKWGNPIPDSLIEKVVGYLPNDIKKLHSVFEGATCSWIHSDIMDDNLYLEPQSSIHLSDHSDNPSGNGSMKNGEVQSWKPSHILDFSNLSVGDPILDLIPIHLDIFKGNPHLLKQLLSRYKLPFFKEGSQNNLTEKVMKFQRASYRAMCYCILHEDNILGAIFSIWEDLKDANSWEDIEDQVWGILNESMDLS
uniref:F-box protein n=1 Tax=Chenopodium quinoa TaxID=63459 RepID=A0A803MEA6_CHEQI